MTATSNVQLTMFVWGTHVNTWLSHRVTVLRTFLGPRKEVFTIAGLLSRTCISQRWDGRCLQHGPGQLWVPVPAPCIGSSPWIGGRWLAVGSVSNLPSVHGIDQRQSLPFSVGTAHQSAFFSQRVQVLLPPSLEVWGVPSSGAWTFAPTSLHKVHVSHSSVLFKASPFLTQTFPPWIRRK